MNKDVIYIDVDDDVTAIIGKIKKAKEKIVAVVPPKRTGNLQSAVNLRLLDRMARADKKQLVLITSNQALIALAANASIPVAKNLQSKPEIAEIAAIIADDEDDIIDGSELSIGDHAGSFKVNDGTRSLARDPRSSAMEVIDIDNDSNVSGPISASSAGTGYAARTAAKNSRGKVKIPNFNSFRKRLFLGIGGGVVLIALLVWMFVFAPAATVIVTASSTAAPVSSTVKLGGTAATDFKAGIVKSVAQQEKKDVSIDFDATGTKDLGTPATGTVKFSTYLVASLGTIPAGTKLTAISGVIFTTDNAVTLTTANAIIGVQTSMTAVDNGTNYNGASGAVSGAPSGVTATIVGSTGGGTSKIAKVVSSDDIERAKGLLIGQPADAEKKLLTAKFTADEKVIDSSFTIDRADPISVPALNTEATSGKAKLTISTTYTIYAFTKADLDSYLNSSLQQQMKNAAGQKIYDTGIDKVGLSNFKKEGDTMSVAVTATGQIGPKIDEAAIKQQVKGKIYGEVQAALQSIDGIKNVDVKFSYFWVRTVPNDTNKIHIEFKLENN